MVCLFLQDFYYTRRGTALTKVEINKGLGGLFTPIVDLANASKDFRSMKKFLSESFKSLSDRG